ncbi:M23 family metallopeptidase [Novacetimonas pomaceti]|uniref:M23 family peptidase n=1 Tax=Novacetimonas pomaceti TaxID=2021998 RepID=A0ABX5P0B6_9PROT|nr:M23 family metallopeptidase [Novacetimonas pomaceti]PYD47207.1 M23 family peptidase [Novacetimonas pomaceti]
MAFRHLIAALLLFSGMSAASAAPVTPPHFPQAPGLFGRAELPASAPVESIVLSPLFNQRFVCADHPDGELRQLGDALGTDCLVIGGMIDRENGFFRLFRTDGKRNEDWYGWHTEVLAPFTGTVVGVSNNPVTNTPGSMKPSLPSFIVFRRADDLIVAYAHVTDIRVRIGDRVSAGQVVALDGNNGFARAPHVHVGAYRGTTPFQIRWDLRAEHRIFPDQN